MFTDVRTPVTGWHNTHVHWCTDTSNRLTQHSFIEKHSQLHVPVVFSRPQAVYTNAVKCVLNGKTAHKKPVFSRQIYSPNFTYLCETEIASNVCVCVCVCFFFFNLYTLYLHCMLHYKWVILHALLLHISTVLYLSTYSVFSYYPILVCLDWLLITLFFIQYYIVCELFKVFVVF